jgi:PhnB protein
VAEALIDRIDRTIDQLLAREDASAALQDPELAALARIAHDLRDSPSATFKTRLRRQLERSTTMPTVLEPVNVREGFTTVTPYLRMPDAGFADFLAKTFGAAETLSQPAGAGTTHREVRIGNSMLMIGEGGMPASEQRRPQAFHVFVDDVDEAFDRAIAAGGKSLGAVEDRPYGERSGFVEDPYGNYWYIARHLGGTAVPAGYRTLTPYLHPHSAASYVEFLQRGFGAVEEFRHATPDGRVMHAQLRIGNAVMELGDTESEGAPRLGVFYLYVADPDALYAQAVAAGATPHSPVADQWYGDRVGSVKDPSGIVWHIARPA